MGQQNKNVKISIKLKLLGVILPVLILSVLILTIVSYYRSKSIIADNAEGLLTSSTKNQQKQIEGWLSNNLAYFNSAKAILENSNGDYATTLDSFYGLNSNFSEGLYIVSENGETWLASDATPITVSIPSEERWFQEGTTRINMAYGSPHVNSFGNLVITASGILLDGSNDLRIVAADVSLNRISIIVNALIEMSSAESVLVDRGTGTILSHQNADFRSETMESISEYSFYDDVWQYIKNNDFDSHKIDGYLINTTKIQGTNWALVSYAPESEIFKELNGLRYFMIIVSIISILFIAIFVERITHRFIKPIRQLTDTIVIMSDGDFTIDVNVTGNDEISLMSQSVQDFILVMRNMISDLNTIAKTLHSKADNSSVISSELRETSHTQSDSMSNLTDTVEQLTTSVNEIAESASSLSMIVSDTTNKSFEVNKNMAKTVSASEVGQQDMLKVKDAMNSIETSISELEDAVGKVGQASNEITEIVNLIGSIAGQTNLLALNASIEAARAGEAGRGFAVVASEIGNLANTSSDAVSQISGLINDISKLVQDAVKQANDSAGHIKTNSDLITNAAETFDSIFSSIRDTNQIIDLMIKDISHVEEVATSVAAISEEQAASSQEILSTSELMLLQSNNIANNSKTVADDANQLKQTAEDLGRQVNLFKI